MKSTGALKQAVHQLTRLPGVGERTATRLIYWLLRQEPEVSMEIGRALMALPTQIRRCSRCFALAEGELCGICSNASRSAEIVCLVEKPQDIAVIESSGEFKGSYHVLDGCISPLQGIGPDQLRIRELLQRLKTEPLSEVLVATDPTTEGDATALYLAGLLKPLSIKVTRLAHGIAVGTELEYANRSSVARALANRQEM
jgi:recombination protein RecR